MAKVQRTLPDLLGGSKNADEEKPSGMLACVSADEELHVRERLSLQEVRPQQHEPQEYHRG